MKSKKIVLLSVIISLMFLIAIRLGFGFRDLKLQISQLDNFKVLAALILFVFSVILRLKRTQILISVLKPNSLIGNLQGSSIGYVANLLLPFRLGEIARAYFLSRYIGISLGFTVGAIALDRGLDLVMIFTSLIGHYGLNGMESIDIFSKSELTVIATGTLIFIIFIAAILRAKLLLLGIQNFSGVFNEKINNRLRTSFWGLILIFQQILQNRRLLRRYLFVVFLSWIFTYSAILLLVASTQDIVDQELKITGSIPFISFIILNGNDYFSAYSLNLEKLTNLISPYQFADNFIEVFSSLSWLLLTFPYLIFGLLAMIQILVRKKLSRRFKLKSDPISKELSKLTAPSSFLDSFFTKEKIIESIHRRSVTENFQVIEYFKGGSDAVTMLVQKSSIKIVQKVSGPKGLKQLKAQQEWLQDVESEGIVKVLDSNSSGEDFQLELEYIADSTSLFDYIHTNSIESSKKVILNALDILELDVYGDIILKEVTPDLQQYLTNCFYERIDAVTKQSPKFQKFVNSRNPIYINGELYYDLQTIFEKIQASEECRQVLSRMKSTERCHGDLTVDNILVRTETGLPILIDPSDDNLLKGPLIDISRLMQSLLGGYEFLNQDTSEVNLIFDQSKIHIDFHDLNSNKYGVLSNWLFEDVLPKKLTENEIKAVKFHVGIFYSRMLTHRILINEKTMYKYVAVSIRYLNEFFEEVDCGDE